MCGSFAMGNEKRMGGATLIMRTKTVMLKRTTATVGLIALLWIMSTLMIPSSSHAAILFDSDFETCTAGTGNDFPCEGWDDFDQEAVGHEEAVSGFSFSGNKSMKHTFDRKEAATPATAGNTKKPSIYHALPDMTHMFLRVTVRYSPGFQICDNGGTKMIRFRGTAGYPILWLMNQRNVYALIMEAPGDYRGTYVISTTAVPSQTSWDQVEVEYKLNTPGQSDGLVRIWINGVLRGEQLNKAYIGPTPTSKCGNGSNTCPSTLSYQTVQVYAQCGLGTVHYDRIAVGNTRIGPTQSRLADSTPPASPQGFRAY